MKVYYRYSVGNATAQNWNSDYCESNPASCFLGSNSENSLLDFRNNFIDIVIKAEGDVDGDGENGRLFITDEPPGRITYVNYSTY